MVLEFEPETLYILGQHTNTERKLCNLYYIDDTYHCSQSGNHSKVAVIKIIFNCKGNIYLKEEKRT